MHSHMLVVGGYYLSSRSDKATICYLGDIDGRYESLTLAAILLVVVQVSLLA